VLGRLGVDLYNINLARAGEMNEDEDGDADEKEDLAVGEGSDEDAGQHDGEDSYEELAPFGGEDFQPGDLCRAEFDDKIHEGVINSIDQERHKAMVQFVDFDIKQEDYLEDLFKTKKVWFRLDDRVIRCSIGRNTSRTPGHGRNMVKGREEMDEGEDNDDGGGQRRGRRSA